MKVVLKCLTGMPRMETEIMNTMMTSLVNEYMCIRCDIENDCNGKMKLGCVAFSKSIKHQCVLCVWDKLLQYT